MFLARFLFLWRHIPDKDLITGTHAIIGMGFGANTKGRNESPGDSNKALARIIYSLGIKRRVPIIVQREIAEALKALSLPISPNLVISEDDGQFHITSREVLLQAWQYCRKRNWSRVIIVAHPAHILRCAWVAEKIGFEVRLPDVTGVPYEPHSKQWWTRNKMLFAIWELYARIGWYFKGYF